MRVIAGVAKGRPLKAVPGTGTRPTTDKVKEAVFSMIGPYFDGGRVLDLFSGTGGLAIEALSRGMAEAVLVDAERRSIGVIRDNLRSSGLSEQAEVYCNDAFRALKALAKRGLRFQLVFLDPPYRFKWIVPAMESMRDLTLLADGALIMAEHDKEAEPETPAGFELKRRAVYGDTAVTIWQYREQSDGNRDRG